MTKKLDKAIQLGIEIIDEYGLLLMGLEDMKGRPHDNCPALIERVKQGDITVAELEQRTNTKAEFLNAKAILWQLLHDYQGQTIIDVMNTIAQEHEALKKEVELLQIVSLEAQTRGLIK